MKALKLFLTLWLVPVAFSALVLFFDGGFTSDINLPAMATVGWLFAIPAFGVAFFVPIFKKIIGNRLVSFVAAATAVVLLTLVSGTAYFYSIEKRYEFAIAGMQSLVMLTFFLTEFLLTQVKARTTQKRYDFDITPRFALRLLCWVVLPEFVLCSVLLLSDFRVDDTLQEHIWFFAWMLTYAVLTNSAALFAIWLCAKVDFLSNSPVLMILAGTLSAMAVGAIVVSFNIDTEQNQFTGVLMALLVPSLFSASALLFLVRQRAESQAKDSLIRNLGKSVSKKQSEYETLKRQVNPHFFFNNLNTLLSFVESDPAKALEFGRRLSNVYRKFLKNDGGDFVALADELAFALEYLEIYRAKFGDAFSQNIQIDANPDEFILADSLQEIIDSIFKHNILDDENKMRIEIFTDDRNLIVRNSVTAKSTSKSLGSGLENIAKRYELLTDKRFSVSETPTVFVASLPILKIE